MCFELIRSPTAYRMHRSQQTSRSSRSMLGLQCPAFATTRLIARLWRRRLADMRHDGQTRRLAARSDIATICPLQALIARRRRACLAYSLDVLAMLYARISSQARVRCLRFWLQSEQPQTLNLKIPCLPDLATSPGLQFVRCLRLDDCFVSEPRSSLLVTPH